MYDVEYFMYFDDIAKFLNTNPLYECIQIVFTNGYKPFKLLYKIQESLSWYKRHKLVIYKYFSKWYSLIIRYGKSH